MSWTLGVPQRPAAGIGSRWMDVDVRLLTDRGPLAARDLRPGDDVRTESCAVAKVLATGTVRPHRDDAIRIRAGVLAPGLPTTDVTLAPRQIVHCASSVAVRLCGSSTFGVRAEDLLFLPGVERIGSPRHLMQVLLEVPAAIRVEGLSLLSFTLEDDDPWPETCAFVGANSDAADADSRAGGKDGPPSSPPDRLYQAFAAATPSLRYASGRARYRARLPMMTPRELRALIRMDSTFSAGRGTIAANQWEPEVTFRCIAPGMSAPSPCSPS